jgi:hypothetical protein
MRSALVALAGTAILAVSLSGCAGQSEAPASGQPAVPGNSASGDSASGNSATESPARQSGAGEQAGSPSDELTQIRSTLDAIDSELAGDGSP